MARATSVSLGEHYEQFIGEQVESGRYDSASEVIEDGLRMLEAHQRQLDWLRARMTEAEAEVREGRIHEMNDAFWEELDRKVDERIKRGERPSPHVCP